MVVMPSSILRERRSSFQTRTVLIVPSKTALCRSRKAGRWRVLPVSLSSNHLDALRVNAVVLQPAVISSRWIPVFWSYVDTRI